MKAPTKRIYNKYPNLKTTVRLSLVTDKLRPPFVDLPRVNNSMRAYDTLLPLFKEVLFIKEEFHILILNNNHRVLAHSKISEGGVSGTVVDPKIVFSTTLLVPGAKQIVLAHNHPSGLLEPSESDLRITQQLVKAARILDFTIVDHIIIADDQFYSFADSGKL